MKLVSACLIGLNCKYNAGNNTDERVLRIAEKEILIPVCPEQLGGLRTPRPPAEILNNKVIDEDANDLSSNFISGAYEVLKIAKLYDIHEAILKDGSPSCGSSMIYDGTFTRTKIRGQGYCSKLLIKNNINVICENDL